MLKLFISFPSNQKKTLFFIYTIPSTCFNDQETVMNKDFFFSTMASFWLVQS